MKKIFTLLLLALWSISSSIAQDKLSILLVQDNSAGPERLTAVKAAIDAAGYTYTVFDAAADKVAPSYEVLSNYELVLWYAGNDQTCYFWNGNETVNQALKMYLDNGGMLWLLGFNVLRDKYAAPPVTFSQGSFEFDYLGIARYVMRTPGNDNTTIGAAQVDAVSGNPICQTSPVKWSFTSGTMWGIDAIEPHQGALSVYKFGPSGHSLAQYSAGIFYETQEFKVLTFTFEMARLKNPALEYRTSIFSEVLNYFEQNIPQKNNILSISIKSEKGATAITQNGGTLQLVADILPLNFSANDIKWSIQETEKEAFIDATGLVIAGGNLQSNETIHVIASSKTDSQIFDIFEINISGQGK